MILRPLLVLLLLAALPLAAQVRVTGFHAGYYTPLFTQPGLVLGLSAEGRPPADHTTDGRPRVHHFAIVPQVAYFRQAPVAHHLMLQPEWTYRRQRPGKRFHWTAAAGTGYLWRQQRTEGTLDLATGNMTYRSEAQHAFVPTLHLGLGVSPERRLGFYARGFYGWTFPGGDRRAAFLGLSTGILWNRKPRPDA